MSDGRVAFVYHLRYPETVGGAERYYAALARELSGRRPVTYITRAYATPPGADWDGVEVLALTPVRPDAGGLVARTLPKLGFALRLHLHLLLRGGRYAAVHACCFPHVAVLAAALALLPHRGTLLLVDWHEVQSRGAWRRRLGRKGVLGHAVQRLAIRCGDAAVTFSRLHGGRLRDEGRRDAIELVPEFPPDARASGAVAAGGERERLVMFAGRLVAEKRAHLLPEVVAELGADWRGVVFGDGPERERVERAAAVSGRVEVRGFVPWHEVSAAMLRACALVFPSEREGFGLAVLEAAAHGLPSVLVEGPDNAATELIEPGENGVVCPEPDPAALADAVRALGADPEAHGRARAWFDRASSRYSVAGAAERLETLHARLRGAL